MRCSVLTLVLLAACPEPQTDTGLPTPATRPDDTDVTGVDLIVVGYNVESGDAQPGTIADIFREVQGEALWGFSETLNQSWLNTFAVAAADDGTQNFQSILGNSGNNDRLGILWDDNVLEFLGSTELNNINVGGTARAPLVATFRIRENDREFKFMVNHLWRTDAQAREEQAELLNDWAAGETMPIIAVGDYNFDWSVEGGEADHDVGYDRMIENGVWVWNRPDPLVATQCSFSFDGVLDFTFVANDAKNWPGTSTVLFPTNVYCQDDDQKPDHRPVETQFFIPDPQ